MGGKGVVFEEAARVPLMLRVPGVKASHISNPVCNIDIVPTLLALLGSRAGAGLPGQSLMPLASGGALKEDHVFFEWNAREPNPKRMPQPTEFATAEEILNARASHWRAVVSPDGWKLCLRDKDLHELYNLHDDPGEKTNLYREAKHRNVVDRLTAEIKAWQATTGDRLKVAG